MGAKRKRASIRKPVNPYLFLLAKRLAQHYYFGLKNPSDLQFVKMIYDRYKSKKFENTIYIDNSKKRTKRNGVIVIEEVIQDKYAKGIAKRIHNMLKSKDFCFTDKMLDYLVLEIRGLSPFVGDAERPEFASWKEFVNRFKDDRGAFDADNLCKRANYFDLSKFERKVIQDAVEYKCLKLFSRNQETGHNRELGFTTEQAFVEYRANNIVAQNDSYTIRIALKNEICEAVLLRNQYQEYAKKQRVESMQAWLDANPNSMILYSDEHGIGGYVSLLPLADHWFEELLNSKKFTKPILKSDILCLGDTHKAKIILIESIEAVTLRARALLIFYLPIMLEKLLHESRHDFNVLYIGNSEYEQSWLKKSGFSGFTTLTGQNIREERTLYLASGQTILSIINGGNLLETTS